LIAIVLDAIFSIYILGPRKLKLWQWLISAAGFGIFNSILVNLALHYIITETYSAAETLGKIIIGCIVHPLICITLTGLRRWQIHKWNQEDAKGTQV
jgi:hypothetical protein